MTVRGGSRPGAPTRVDEAHRYDALLVVSYGGPEGPDDVMPFLENATQTSTAIINERGRDVYTYVLNVKYQQPDSTLLTTQPLAATLIQGYRSGASRTR